MKNEVRILMDVALNLQTSFGNVPIFAILILPIHECGWALQFLVSSVLFLCFLNFSLWGHSLLRISVFLRLAVFVNVCLSTGSYHEYFDFPYFFCSVFVIDICKKPPEFCMLAFISCYSAKIVYQF